MFVFSIKTQTGDGFQILSSSYLCSVSLLLFVFCPSQILLTKSSRIARCANRIVQVARGEVENLDDPKFKHEVGTAAENLAERKLD